MLHQILENFTPIEIQESYEPGGRYYTYNGFKRPSVTTILSNTRTAENKAFLDKWNANNPGKMQAAAKRGTAVHAMIEAYLKGDDQGFDQIRNESPKAYGYFKHALKFLDHVQALLIETPIFDVRVGFGGRLDCLGFYKSQGESIPLLFDWKTSSKPKNQWYDYPYQLAAYIKSFNALYKDFPVHPDHALLMCLNPTGIQFEMYTPTQIEHNWLVFQRRANEFHKVVYPMLLAQTQSEKARGVA